METEQRSRGESSTNWNEYHEWAQIYQQRRQLLQRLMKEKLAEEVANYKINLVGSAKGIANANASKHQNPFTES